MSQDVVMMRKGDKNSKNERDAVREGMNHWRAKGKFLFLFFSEVVFSNGL